MEQQVQSEQVSAIAGFGHYFSACGVKGSTLLFSLREHKWRATDTVDIYEEVLPASTFKILNLLIALETGVLEHEQQIIRWPGSTDTVRYGYRPDIYRDMTVAEAFDVSAVWVFIELSKQIGKNTYRQYLLRAGYGNNQLDEPGEDFWNEGSFGISPMNQVIFLKNLYEEKLPFSKRNMELVKRVMLVEKGEDYAIRAKTGWTRAGGVNTGWWIGYVETAQDVHVFATKLVQDRRDNRIDFGPCRKQITRAILTELGILEN